MGSFPHAAAAVWSRSAGCTRRDSSTSVEQQQNCRSITAVRRTTIPRIHGSSSASNEFNEVISI